MDKNILKRKFVVIANIAGLAENPFKQVSPGFLSLSLSNGFGSKFTRPPF